MSCELVMLSRCWIGETGKAMECDISNAVSLRRLVVLVFFILAILITPSVVLAAPAVLKEVKIQSDHILSHV